MALLPKVKLKAMLSFPSHIIDGAGVDVERIHGAYKINIAFDDFMPPVSSIGDAAHQNVLLWNNVTNNYALAPVNSIATGLAGPPGPTGATGPAGPPGADGSGIPATALPLVNAPSAVVGIAIKYAREDHVHPTDTSRAPNIFIQAGTGAVTRTMQDKARDIVSVLDFGADPTGGSDSTTAMQNAHNTGHLVYYPKGLYLFTTLTIAQGGIVGEGMALTNLTTTSLGSSNAITYTGVGGIATAAPARFENFLLQVSGAKTAGSGIIFAPVGAGESYYAAVKGVQIVNFPIGIYFVAASNWTVFDCKIIHYRDFGIVVDNTNNADSGDSCITNCLLNTGAPTGIGVKQLASGGLKIIGNKFLGGEIGYELSFYNETSTGDLMIIGNSFEQMSNQSIKLARASGSAYFGQITITSNQFALANMHIAATAFIYELTISGNAFTLTSGGVGIYLDSVDTFAISGNTMRGNAANTGIFHSGCFNGLIIGNQIIGFTTNVTAASGSVYTYNNPT